MPEVSEHVVGYRCVDATPTLTIADRLRQKARVRMPQACPVVARQSDLRFGRALTSTKRLVILQNSPKPKLAIPSASERKPTNRETVSVY